MLFHVIDNEPVICEYIADLLDTLGHEAQVFQSPVDYLEFLRSEAYVVPTAIFTDLSMPRMSGYEMINQVLNIYPDQRFIIVSGKLNVQDEYQNSSCQFLQKPFNVEQFKEVLGALDRQRAA